MAELGGHQTINVKGAETTPSLLYNNLSAQGTLLAYVHKNDTVLVDITKPDQPAISHPRPADGGGKGKAAVYQVKLCQIGSRIVLIVVSMHAVQFWDAEKESQLAEVRAAADDKDVFISRGCAVLPGKGDSALVLVGHSTGAISAIDFEGSAASKSKTLNRHADNISDICAGVADGDQVVIASADIAGEMVTWTEGLDEVGKTFFPGDTMTSIQIAGAYIAASFGSGLIRLYNLDCTVAVEIAAHARWVTALAWAPSAGLLASVSEDMLLCLWRLPCKANGGKAQLAAHKLLKDCLLTGVQFVGDEARVVATAYDWDRLHMFDVPA